MKTSEARSFSKFMQDLVPGDILVGKVKSWRRANFEMELVGLDCGRLRKVPENISILCNVPQVQFGKIQFYRNISIWLILI